MNAHVIAAVGFACIAAATPGAYGDTTPPPVDSMTCDQMVGELTVAGQKMSQQLDPEFAKEAQAMHDEAQGASATGAIASGIGMSIACSIPGVGMLCMMGQQAQGMGQMDQSQENIERMQKQMERLQKAMEGLDQERLTALTQRFEEQKCETPQQ